MIEIIIETFLKQIALNPNTKLIYEIFSFIETDIHTEQVVGLEEKIAKLFCRAIEALDQDMEPDKETQNKIVKAFENISTIANNICTSGELMCIYLLNSVHSTKKGIEIDEYVENEFKLLLDNLELIRVVFKILDENNERYFPIATLLFRLIQCENLLEEIENVKTIQALMLALQIFDKSQYPQELKDIQNMISGKNLKFIEYLYHQCKRIGGDDWKTNYEMNGSLILYDHEDNKVLVRNSNRAYFETDYDVQALYNCSEIIAEHNNSNGTIAYFVEYPIDIFDSVDLKKELSRENNFERLGQIIDIVYLRRNFNILSDYTLIEKEGKILPINPFGMNDRYIIINGMADNNGVSAISRWFKTYGLLKLVGSGLQYINLGALIAMEEIYPIPVADFEISDNNYLFGNVLKKWVEACAEKHSKFNAFLAEYEGQLNYIYNEKTLYEKIYNQEYFVPYPIPEEIINNLDFDERIFRGKVCLVNVFNDFINDKKTIITKEGTEISNYEHEGISDEDFYQIDGEIIVCVDSVNKKIYFGEEVKIYFLTREKIQKLNESMLLDEIVDKVDEIHICDISKKMKIFDKGLRRLHPNIPIESIARYRIINHLLLLRPDSSTIKAWLDLMQKHEIVDYSVVDGKSPLKEKEGVLYVAKERGRAQSTLKYINDTYFNNPIKRNIIDLYDQKVTKKEEYYYTGNKKIEKIVFLFDLIQNGTATVNTLHYYLNEDKEEDDKHMVFTCEGKNAFVAEIIKKNNCKLEVYSIYAGDTGIIKIKDDMSKNFPLFDVDVLEPVQKLKRVVTKTDMDNINKLYRGKLKGKIHEDCYLVVREYNQPKLNMMSDDLLELQKTISLFCKRPENGIKNR